MGIPEDEEAGKGIENPFHKIISENFPNIEKHEDIKVMKHK